MKKVTTEQKIWQEKHASKNFNKELKRKIKRKKLKLEKSNKKQKNRRAKNFIQKPQRSKHEQLIAPKVFSFIKNTEETINYFKDAATSFKKSVPVFFDLSQVEDITLETITFLCAFVNEPKIVNKTPFQGNVPKIDKLKDLIVESGFYDFVSSNRPKDQRIKDKYEKLIHRITRKKVDGEIAGKVVLSALKHTFNSSDIRNQDIYEILIECMANTNNHSGGLNNTEPYNWWLLAYKEKETNKTIFCFLDIGIGIFGSLHRKHEKNLLPQRIIEIFLPDNHSETLKNIFKGKRETSVDRPGRGQGINNIYNIVKKDKNIKNFTIVSNNVLSMISFDKQDIINQLPKELMGTLYYWELTPNE